MSVRWGILGTGKIANKFVGDFQYVEGGCVHAVASRDQHRANGFALKYDIPTAYGSYHQLIEAPDLDVIYIALPHNLHFEFVSYALKAGKAVVCEKPFTINSGEFAKLMDLKKSNDHYMVEALWSFFLPALLKAKEWVDHGRIGKVRQLSADFCFNADFDPEGRLYAPSMAGGALEDIGIYPIAMALMFQGAEPLDCKVLSHKAVTGVDANNFIIFDYGESVALLSSSFECFSKCDFQIAGEEGYITLDPRFHESKTCRLFKGNKEIDRFVDSSPCIGYAHEINAINRELNAGLTESKYMPLHLSCQLRKLMDSVRERF